MLEASKKAQAIDSVTKIVMVPATIKLSFSIHNLSYFMFD